MPSAKMANWVRAPPEKSWTNPRIPPDVLTWSRISWIASVST